MRPVNRAVIDERYAQIIEAIYDGRRQLAIETEVTFEDGRKGRITAELEIRDLAAAAALDRVA